MCRSIPSPRGKKAVQMPHQLVLNFPFLKDKFRLQSNTLHAFQREICRNDIFKALLKTLLKELFTNKVIL